jgi:hypothetical protein
VAYDNAGQSPAESELNLEQILRRSAVELEVHTNISRVYLLSYQLTTVLWGNLMGQDGPPSHFILSRTYDKTLFFLILLFYLLANLIITAKHGRAPGMSFFTTGTI